MTEVINDFREWGPDADHEGVCRSLLQFKKLLNKSLETAYQKKEDVFLSNDEKGNWSNYLADEEGYTPAILLAVSPDGTLRLIDNTVAGNSEEPWRR